MPRIRSIHPEACESDKLVLLSAAAERTLWRLTTHSDDDGRGVDNPKLIAAKLYPLHDDQDVATVDAQLWELVNAGMMVRYEVDGKRYYEIHDFTDWQRPKRKTDSKLPPPTQGDAVMHAPSPNGPGEHVGNTSPPPHPHGPPGVGVGEGVGEGELLGGEPPDARSLAVEVEGWDVPFPVKAAGGCVTEAVAGWARKVGLEVPRHGPPQDLTKRLLEIVGDVLGEAKHSHGVKVALIGELIGDVTDQEVPKEAWGHLRRLVSTARPVPLLAAVTTALNGGAGLTGEYASDPLAISKYAVGVLNGNGRKHG